MKYLIHRAHRLCDREEDLRWELGFLKYQFISNGYPVREVDRVFASYVPGVEVEEEEEDRPTIFAPFVPVFSEKFAKLVRAHGVEVVFTKPVSLQS